MAAVTALDPKEQARRRRRSKLSQTGVCAQFETPMSIGSLSDYERGKKPLPYEFTPEDYEHALARALLARQAAAK